MIVQNSPVHNEALKNSIPVFLPNNFIDQKIIDTFVNLKADLAIVMAYGKLLPEEILKETSSIALVVLKYPATKV